MPLRNPFGGLMILLCSYVFYRLVAPAGTHLSAIGTDGHPYDLVISTVTIEYAAGRSRRQILTLDSIFDSAQVRRDRR